MSRVFVLGNASIDTTLRVPRLPLAGETLMATGIQRSPGGKGLNQAVVAARTGAEVHFMAALGTEPETALIRDALARENLAKCDLVDVGAPTDLSSLMVAPDGENCIISTGACCDALSVEVAVRFVAAMREADILLVQGNLSEPATRAAMRAARELGAQIMLNTAPIRWDYGEVAKLADLVVANRHEAATITGEDHVCEAIRAFPGMGRHPCPGLIVTLGADGCVATDNRITPYPAQPVDAVVDTTGAGDVFCGALAGFWATRTAYPFLAINAAQRAAALSVTRAGCFASFPSAAELAQLARSFEREA